MAFEGPPSAEPSVLGEHLMAGILMLRRRAYQIAEPTGELTRAERELLRKINDQPSSSVASLAQELHLAPNTVSTLVRQLVDKGFVERGRDDNDARVARLIVTPRGASILAMFRDRRTAVVTAALYHLSPEDREAIARALPALRSLADWMVER